MPFVYENDRRAGKTHPGRIEMMPEYLVRMKNEGKNPGAHTDKHIPTNTRSRRWHRRHSK